MDTKKKVILWVTISVMLVGGGVAAYFLLSSKKEEEKALPKFDTKALPPQAANKAVEDTTARVKADIAASKGESPLRTDYDHKYNYQKRGGIWYSALKSNPDSWASWGIESNFAKNNPTGWTTAVALLDARYPND